MDAFAVSVADGSRATHLRLGRAFGMALTFGLLGLVGGKMIYGDLRAKAGAEDEMPRAAGVTTLLVLAVATSIDALAVGFSLTFLNSILVPVINIGLVTFILCLAGVHLGHRYNRLGRGKVQIVGGLILIAIGVRILVEHLS